MQKKKFKYKTLKILLIFLIIILNLIFSNNLKLINNITNKSKIVEQFNKKKEIFKDYPLIPYNDFSFDSTRYGLKIGLF